MPGRQMIIVKKTYTTFSRLKSFTTIYRLTPIHPHRNQRI